MIRYLYNFFPVKKDNGKQTAKPTTPLSDKHFTWDKEIVDIYGKPTSLEELLFLQLEARDGFLKELGVTEEDMSPTPTPK